MYSKYFYNSRLYPACCYLILNICFFSINLNGQNYFSKRYNIFNKQENIANLSSINNNKYIIAGNITSYYFKDSATGYVPTYRLYFATVDSKGNLIDTLLIDEKYQNTATFMNFHLCDRKPYFLFLSLDTISANRTYYIVKIKSLSPIDTQFIVLQMPCTACRPLRAILNNRNEVIILGKDSNTVSDPLFIAVYDSNGVFRKIKTYSNILGIDPNSVIEDNNGNYIIAGMRWQQLHDTAGIFNTRWYGMIDSNLNMIWYDWPHQGTVVDSRFDDVIQLSDGNYLFTGNNGIGLSAVKVNQTGNIIWQKNYFVDSLSYQVTYRTIFNVIEKNGYLYAIAAKDTIYNGQPNNFIGFPVFIKMTMSGKIIWTRQLSFNQKNLELLLGVKPTVDGFMIFGSGSDTLYSPFYYNRDAWLVKTDTNGCVIPGCNLNDVIDTSNSGIEEYENVPSENDFTVYPNPTNGMLKIITQNISTDFIITDVLGKTLKTGNTKDEIDVSDFVNGLYFISINQKWKKFLKE